MFKTINHIDDIWPFVKDIEGITLNVKEDEGFQVINYQFVTPTTFDIPEALEARGIKFDLEGNIIARPFHKFFNLFEKQGIDELDWSEVVDIQTKHDGSMVHGVMLNGKFELMTRAGLSDQAKEASDFMNTNINCDLKARAIAWVINGYTPIYEYVAPTNRIVLQYDEPALLLLAVRNNKTGEYQAPTTYDDGGQWGRPENLVNHVKHLKGEEGIVIVWPNGHRIKIKADEYVTLHRAKSMLEREINVVRCIFDGTADDLIAAVSEEDRERLKNYIKRFNETLKVISRTVKTQCDSLDGLSQKDFALHILSDPKAPDGFQGLMFNMRKLKDEKTPFEITWDFFNKRFIKQDRIDEFAELFANARWVY